MAHGDRCGGRVHLVALIIGLLVHVDDQILRELVELEAWQRLREKIRDVPLAWDMGRVELSLGHSVGEPEKPHVH